MLLSASIIELTVSESKKGYGMKILRELTMKEWILGILLMGYLGGFSYYWGAITNDLYLIVVFAFLATHFIGNRITLNFIFANHYDHRIRNRYIRLLSNFGANLLIANLIMLLIRWMHSGSLDEFLIGPVIYGVTYGILYLIYFIMSLKKVDNEKDGSLLER